jgi:hypothetical protein
MRVSKSCLIRASFTSSRKNVSSRDQARVRFDIFKINYGCYVDLINTTKAPHGLFEVDENDGFTEVPRDDYRSIRRPILLPADVPILSSADGNAQTQLNLD